MRRQPTSWGPINIPDSFVVPDNKVLGGNGEAKLYVGVKTDPALRSFFGPPGFSVDCRFDKDQLLAFMNDIRPDYENPKAKYRAGSELATLWRGRRDDVTTLSPARLRFTLEEQTQVQGERCYVKGKGSFSLLRSLPLPNRAELYFDRREDEAGDYFVVILTHVADGDEQTTRDQLERQCILELQADPNLNETEREQLIVARVGQGIYRSSLLASCGAVCPITGIDDERLLIASHIKPWRSSTNEERLDPQNGFVLSPTHDTLFDAGLITFTDDCCVILSNELSHETAVRVGLRQGKPFPRLPIPGSENTGRREYLRYHRKEVFRP